jgi:hypothetical protein
VFGKLKPKTLLRIRNSLPGHHRNYKLAIANSADSDDRDGAEPFQHSKITLCHRRLCNGSCSVLQLNVCTKSLIEHFVGFWLSAWSIRNGFFDADDLMALGACAETMTGAIHFVLWSKPSRSILVFSCLQFPTGQIALPAPSTTGVGLHERGVFQPVTLASTAIPHRSSSDSGM